MYFIDIRNLKKDLLSQSLTDRQSLIYFILFVLLNSMRIYPSNLTKTLSFEGYVDLIFQLILILILIYAFWCHGGNKINQFFYRLFPLYFVQGVRLIPFTFGVLVITNAIKDGYRGWNRIEGDLGVYEIYIAIVQIIIPSVVFAYYLGRHLKELAQEQGE